MIPIYIFYSMFGFQRTGDALWAAADQMARGFLLGATAGRTTLTGEGLQHNDGHSLLLAATNPAVVSYDPAFVVRDRPHRRATGCGGCTASEAEDVFYYLTVYNEPYVQPAEPENLDVEGLLRGLYRYLPAPDGRRARGRGSSRPAWRCRGRCGRASCCRQDWGVRAEVWSVTSWIELRRDARGRRPAQLPAPGGGAAAAVRHAGAVRGRRGRWSRCRTGCARCRT